MEVRERTDFGDSSDCTSASRLSLRRAHMKELSVGEDDSSCAQTEETEGSKGQLSAHPARERLVPLLRACLLEQKVQRNKSLL